MNSYEDVKNYLLDNVKDPIPKYLLKKEILKEPITDEI